MARFHADRPKGSEKMTYLDSAGTPSEAKSVVANVRLYADWAMEGESSPVREGLAPGNLATLQPGEMLLPGYVSKREDGFYVDVAKMRENPSAFVSFVSQTFSSGAYFFDLDFDVFETLVHRPEEIAFLEESARASEHPGEVRFAADAFEFLPERRSLYRGVKVSPDLSTAKYLFEPVYVDRPITRISVTGSVIQETAPQRTRLDFDEFVAHLWNRGVRYGLLENRIRELIGDDSVKGTWETVAKQLDPVPGRDAEIREVTDRVKQDRTPLILENGRADFKVFRNRFPQVREAERILEKIPSVLGIPGKNVSGSPVRPEAPKDADIEALAGEGVRIETSGDRTYLTATMPGFIDLDGRTRKISINEKIIHRDGASMKTTGCLDLEGEYFVEHGDVEHGISIAGHNVEIKGNLYGVVQSKSGKVEVAGSVVSGAVHSLGDEIELNGKLVSNSRIEAPNGKISIRYAENCVIIGKEVRVEVARNCQIIAEEAFVRRTISTYVAAKRGEIALAEEETVLTVEIPDPEYLRTLVVELSAARLDAAAELRSVREDRILATYLDQRDKVRAFEAAGGTLPDDKRLAYSKLAAAAKAKMDAYAKAADVARKAQRALDEAVEALQRSELWVSAKISRVSGFTVAKIRKLGARNAPLASMDDTAAKQEVSNFGTVSTRIFMDSSGSLDWKPPVVPEPLSEG